MTCPVCGSEVISINRDNFKCSDETCEISGGWYNYLNNSLLEPTIIKSSRECNEIVLNNYTEENFINEDSYDWGKLFI